MTSDYDIGFGKPPKKSQFKKGSSGNPKGRPKGSKSLKTVIRKELAGKVKLLQNGKPKRVTKMEALVMRLVKDALEGKPKAQTEILKLAQAYLPDETQATSQQPVSAEDQSLVDAFVKRMMAKNAKEAGNEGS